MPQVRINVAKKISILSTNIFIIRRLQIQVYFYSGALFRTNVVDDITNVKTPDRCQAHCQDAREAGCQFYIWEKVTNDCILYNGIYGIEYDNDDDQKCIGHVDECMATKCERKGWNYVKTGSGQNIVQYRAIYDVEDVDSCLKICRLTTDCYFIRYDTTKR